jgi:hypothetical protein
VLDEPGVNTDMPLRRLRSVTPVVMRG